MDAQEDDSFSDVSSVYSEANSVASSTLDGKKLRIKTVKSRFMEGITNPKSKTVSSSSHSPQRSSHSVSTKGPPAKVPPSSKPPPPKPSNARTTSAVRTQTSNQAEKGTWNPSEKVPSVSSPGRSTVSHVASNRASAGQKSSHKVGPKSDMPILTSYAGLDSAQLLQVDLLQWVFLTEKAKRILTSLIQSKEKDLGEALKATLTLQQNISQLQIQLDKVKHSAKLEEIIEQFEPLLYEWSLIQRKHSSNVKELIQVLENAVLRLSLINGAMGNPDEIQQKLSEINDLLSAKLKPIVENHFKPVEEASILASDYAKCSSEMQMQMQQASNLLHEFSSLELHERSLKAQLIQFQRAKERKANANNIPNRNYNFTLNPT